MTIALDTNVLARYITNDHDEQTRAALKLIKKFVGQKNSIFINNIVLCELVWVLDRGYKYKKSEISLVISYILETKEFFFEDHHLLLLAMDYYQNNNCDFTDVLIGIINNHKYKCEKTFSFDKKTNNLREFSILKCD